MEVACTAAEGAGRAARPAASSRRESELTEKWRSVRRSLLYVQNRGAPVIAMHARATVLPMPVIREHIERVPAGASDQAVVIP